MEIDGEAQFAQEYPFLAVSVLEGSGDVDGHPVKKGDHFVIPCGYGSFCLKGDMLLLASTKC